MLANPILFYDTHTSLFGGLAKLDETLGVLFGLGHDFILLHNIATCPHDSSATAGMSLLHPISS